MPDFPTWYASLPIILEHLASLPSPWVDRRTLQELLRVSPRRAQQIMKSLTPYRVGNAYLVDRDHLSQHLLDLASSSQAQGSIAHRQEFANRLQDWRERLLNPPLLIAAPRQAPSLHSLPPSIQITQNQLSIDFQSLPELLSHLLALGRLIESDSQAFASQFCPDQQFT